jgi:hypothetical protein
VEKDAYRKRFDTSDAIILPMVQKGKIEETIMEAVPQLVIQLLNTWLLGQLQNMPQLTVFSISLSVISLTNTIWYYAYWNLFRCMLIRNVPSALSLYNYKLSGVKDGPFSFSKKSSEVVEIELSEIEMRSRTVGGTVLNDDSAGGEQLGEGQLPPNNSMGHAAAAELARPIGAGVSHVAVDVSQGDHHVISGAAEIDAEVCRLRQELQEKDAENAAMRQWQRQIEAGMLERQRLEAELREEKRQMETDMRERQQLMEAEISRLKLELQRLPSVALDPEVAHAQVAVHGTHAAAAAGDILNDIISSVTSVTLV